MDPAVFFGIWLQNTNNDRSANTSANAAPRSSSVTRDKVTDQEPSKKLSDDREEGSRRERVLGGILRRVSDTAANDKPAEILSSDEKENNEKREAFLEDMRPRIDFVRRRIEMMHAGEEEFEEYMESLKKTADKDAEDAEDAEDEDFEEYMERLSKDAEG